MRRLDPRNLLPLLLALTGCDGVLADVACGITADSSDKSATTPSGYFPAHLSRPTVACDGKCIAPIDDFVDEWYSKQLRAADEPSLFRLSQRPVKAGDFVLRFTWLRSFDPSMFITLRRQGGRFELIARELSGAGGYEPGAVRRSVRRPLSPAAAQALLAAIDPDALFAGPTALCDRGCDGSEWLFEIVDHRGYRIVNRWSPEHGPVHRAGRALIARTGWPVEVY